MRRPHTKFGPNQFIRFDVYWIQADTQIDMQSKYILDFQGAWYLPSYSIVIIFLRIFKWKSNLVGGLFLKF